MRSKFGVILLGSLLCCIPAFIYIWFHNMVDPPVVPEKLTTTSWPVEKETSQYKLTLEPVKPPLRRGVSLLKLHIQKWDKKAVDISPKEVEVVMPMGRNTMTAPTHVTVSKSGDYHIQADLEMAGAWKLVLYPDTPSKTLEMPFEVQL